MLDDIAMIDEGRPKQSTHALVDVGLPAVVFTTLLAGRMIWEETVLTLRQGPQMVGFSLVHGAGAMLVLAPLLLLLWFVAAVVVLAISLWRRRSMSNWF